MISIFTFNKTTHVNRENFKFDQEKKRKQDSFVSDLLIQGVQLGVNHSKRRKKKKRNETNQSKNVTVPDEDQDLE